MKFAFYKFGIQSLSNNRIPEFSVCSRGRTKLAATASDVLAIIVTTCKDFMQVGKDDVNSCVIRFRITKYGIQISTNVVVVWNQENRTELSLTFDHIYKIGGTDMMEFFQTILTKVERFQLKQLLELWWNSPC